MKLKGQHAPPGEFASKALFKRNDSPAGWELSSVYYLSLESAQIGCNGKYSSEYVVKWPVEILDNGLLYAPDESEME